LTHPYTIFFFVRNGQNMLIVNLLVYFEGENRAQNHPHPSAI